MKTGIFNTSTGGAERFRPYFDLYRGELELVDLACSPAPENLEIIRETGCEALLYFNTKKEDDAYFKRLAELGIRYISTHSAGYDHFNLEAMEKYGIRGANVPFYSPNAIAEHTVLLTLSVLRHMREQILRVEDHYYALDGLMGKELRNMTVGVIGTGRIGCTTIRCLSGFGPKKIFAFAPHPREEMRKYAEYTDLGTLFASCDILLFHCVLDDATFHLVNRESIRRMKDGVILVNTARGGVLDTEAVLEAVESGKIGGLAIDVIEGEAAVRGKKKFDDVPLPSLKALLAHKNVIFTNHSAFYTDEAYRNLSKTAVDNLLSYARTGTCEFELTGL